MFSSLLLLPCPPSKPLWTRHRRGPDSMPITPKTGSLFHAYSHLDKFLEKLP